VEEIRDGAVMMLSEPGKLGLNVFWRGDGGEAGRGLVWAWVGA